MNEIERLVSDIHTIKCIVVGLAIAWGVVAATAIGVIIWAAKSPAEEEDES